MTGSGSEELLSQLTSSAVVVYAIELLKKSQWFPMITAESRTLNRWAAVLGSGAAAIGVHVAFDSTAGALMITGLTMSGLAHGAWHWLQQMAITQLSYDAAINNKPQAQAVKPSPSSTSIDAGRVDLTKVGKP